MRTTLIRVPLIAIIAISVHLDRLGLPLSQIAPCEPLAAGRSQQDSVRLSLALDSNCRFRLDHTRSIKPLRGGEHSRRGQVRAGHPSLDEANIKLQFLLARTFTETLRVQVEMSCLGECWIMFLA